MCRDEGSAGSALDDYHGRRTRTGSVIGYVLGTYGRTTRTVRPFCGAAGAFARRRQRRCTEYRMTRVLREHGRIQVHGEVLPR